MLFSLLANNMVRRILDELVVPIRKLRLGEPERVALTALIILEGGKQTVNNIFLNNK